MCERERPFRCEKVPLAGEADGARYFKGGREEGEGEKAGGKAKELKKLRKREIKDRAEMVAGGGREKRKGRKGLKNRMTSELLVAKRTTG